MVGRALAFSDPEVQATLRKSFVPLTGDDWYRRRQQDDEGVFFRKVADQGPRNDPKATRQGLYAFTASGKLLAYKNPTNAAAVRELLATALARFQELPEAEKLPRKFSEPRGKLDPRYARTPPEGGLVVRVHARELDALDGDYVRAAPRKDAPGAASLDHLWLTRDEVRSLLPGERAQPGERRAFPPKLVARIARFHLVDATRGEPDAWTAENVEEAELALVLASRSPVTLSLEGKVRLRSPDRSYAARLEGVLVFEGESARGATAEQKVKRFDLVAIGLHEGTSTYTPGARPGKTPLGIAFTLASGELPEDRVPPQMSRWLEGYYEVR